MSKKAYMYVHVECAGERPSERMNNDIHSEVITLYDTDRDRLEKVAIIHNEQHFGGNVNGLRDTYPYPESNCPCNGERPAVRAWNGEEIFMVPYEEWAGDPEVSVLYLNSREDQLLRGKTSSLHPLHQFVRTIFEKAGFT